MTKPTPSLEQTLDHTGTRGAQHNFYSNPVGPYWPFMTSPGPECTSGEPEKRGVWRPSAIRSGHPIKLPAWTSLQSAGRRISSQVGIIIVPFEIVTIVTGGR